MKRIASLLSLIIITSFLISCHSNSKIISELKLEKKIRLDLPEPSGLSFTYNNDGFWFVSDDDSTIYKTDSEFKIVNKIKVNGRDLEGVVFIDSSTIATILERERTFVALDVSGKELFRNVLELEGEENQGLEGLTYNKKKNIFYSVNEKDPSLVLILNAKGKLTDLFKFTFADDLSGIFYDEQNDYIWLLSDESKSIFICDTKLRILQQIGIDIQQAEGIAVDTKSKKVYIVSDPEETVYIYNYK